MTDHQEIDRLIQLYSHIVDGKQWDRLGELFAETGGFEADGTGLSYHGFEKLKDYLSSFPAHPYVHYHTNVVIDVEEGADRAAASYHVFGPHTDGTAVIATCHDTFVRTDAGWRFELHKPTIRERYWTAGGTAPTT